VIVVEGLTSAFVAQHVTSTPPIVAKVGNAFNSGPTSYAKPGKNIAGSFHLEELTSKRLELLKQAKPSIAKVGVLVHPTIPVFVQTLAVARSEVTSKMGRRLNASRQLSPHRCLCGQAPQRCAACRYAG
jgi:ABC-type uncharacterized transport system substrate-binding protein